MVVRGHVKEAVLGFGGQDPGQHAVRADPHVMQAEPVRRPVVPPVSHHVGQVLVQRAARQTFSTCMPRQMASSGTPSRSA